MKSLKNFKCGSIIPNVDIKKKENSQIFDEITIKASPPIWVLGRPIKNRPWIVLLSVPPSPSIAGPSLYSSSYFTVKHDTEGATN